jgi:hypothetical protein
MGHGAHGLQCCGSVSGVLALPRLCAEYILKPSHIILPIQHARQHEQKA